MSCRKLQKNRSDHIFEWRSIKRASNVLRRHVVRSVAETDIVFWYTFGHIPRPEDYPVMHAAYSGFLLKPNGFFEK